MDFNIFMTVIATIIGAIIAGVGSYKGGIAEAKRSHELLRQEKDMERKEIYRENRAMLSAYIAVAKRSLDRAYHDLKGAGLQEVHIEKHLGATIIDHDWIRYLEKSGLDVDDVIIVKQWFYDIGAISAYCRQQGYDFGPLKDQIYRVLNNEDMNSVIKRL
jgi:hypothetical protein